MDSNRPLLSKRIFLGKCGAKLKNKLKTTPNMASKNDENPACFSCRSITEGHGARASS
jgi:hypothetical protein